MRYWKWVSFLTILPCYPCRCVMCLRRGLSPPGCPSNCKHSATPDRQRLWLCVCSCVSLLMCSLSFVVFRCYQKEIPLLFLSPTIHCCLYQAATRGREECWDVKPLHTFHFPIFSLFFSPLCISLPFTPCAPLICSLEAFSRLQLFFCCFWSNFSGKNVFFWGEKKSVNCEVQEKLAKDRRKSGQIKLFIKQFCALAYKTEENITLFWPVYLHTEFISISLSVDYIDLKTTRLGFV